MHSPTMNTSLLSLDNSCQCEERNPMKPLLRYYSLAAGKMSYLRSPFLLAVRLYWGWQFVQTGWGKMHHIGKITAFFTSLNIPFPAFNAYFVTGLLLAFNMLVAYWTADHEALISIFSDPGKFYVADPYTFLFASLMVLILGAGLFSVDALVARRLEMQV